MPRSPVAISVMDVSGALALHVLEVMDAVARSSAEHVVVPLTTTVDRPEPVPPGSTPDSW